MKFVKFIDKRKVDEIPEFIISFLENKELDGFSITDSDKKFQSGCLVPMLRDDYAKMMEGFGDKVKESILLSYPETREDISYRKLIFFGEGVNYSLLSFYTGGQRVLIFKHQRKKITDYWSGKCWEFADNSKNMMEYLSDNKAYKNVLYQ